MTSTIERAVRMCDSCGGVDDHPRHVVGRGPDEAAPTSPDVATLAMRHAGADHEAEVMAQILDQTTVVKHMDCCRADGCPDLTCDLVTAGVEDARGDDLLAHLTKGA